MSSEQKALIKGHGLVLISVLKKEKFKKFAEIGVWKSRTTKRILRHIGDQIDEYWAVDPFDVNLAHTRSERRRTELDWKGLYSHCCGVMMYFHQLKVVKMTSEQASTIFLDGYFDMVYIDAMHTFDHVNADIGYWLPKVREGGIIGGHDYGHRRHPGVKKAVDKWFGEENIKTWPIDTVWMKRV